MKHNYYSICEQCGRSFSAKYPHAKTCSNACRVKKSREKKKSGGKSLRDMTDEERRKLQQIISISEQSYNAIFSILMVHGVYAARGALEATYTAIEAVIADMEKNR